LRRLSITALGAIGALAIVAGPATAAYEPVKGPGGAKFYEPPKKVPKGHGHLIWHRKAGKLMPIDGAKSTTLVLYTSKTPQGKAAAVSGAVSVPRGKAPKGGWPVITFAHGTTGVADSCAPSRIDPTSTNASLVDYIDPELEDWIDEGYAVVRTDYQGLGTPGPHPYLIGTAEGRGVVDIVSAARELNGDIGKKYLISGHSQGGQSALFAAGLAKSWASKLKLRGTVAYAPASHLLEQAQALPALTSPSDLSAIAALILSGAASQSAAIDVNALLTDPALALYPQVDQTCLPGLAEPTSFGGMAPADLLRPGADLSPLYAELGPMNPAVTTSAPILILQGEADTTVFPVFTGQLNQELLALGDQVTYTVYPGIDHGGIVTAGEPEALAFMRAQLPPG
jgi:pimeloyl-ACP methyl ester carboxylesterase